MLKEILKGVCPLVGFCGDSLSTQYKTYNHPAQMGLKLAWPRISRFKWERKYTVSERNGSPI